MLQVDKNRSWIQSIQLCYVGIILEILNIIDPQGFYYELKPKLAFEHFG